MYCQAVTFCGFETFLNCTGEEHWHLPTWYDCHPSFPTAVLWWRDLCPEGRGSGFQAPQWIAELVKVWVSLIDLNSCQGRGKFNVNGFPIHPSFHMAIWTDQLAGWVHVYPSQQVWLPLHSHCRPFSSIAMWVWQTTWKKWTIMVNKKEALLHICFALYWTRKEMSVMELASRPDHVPHTSLFVTRYNSFFDTLIWISNYNYLNKSTF